MKPDRERDGFDLKAEDGEGFLICRVTILRWLPVDNGGRFGKRFMKIPCDHELIFIRR